MNSFKVAWSGTVVGGPVLQISSRKSFGAVYQWSKGIANKIFSEIIFSVRIGELLLLESVERKTNSLQILASFCLL